MPTQSKKDIVKRWTDDKVMIVDQALSAKNIDNTELSKAFGTHQRGSFDLVDLRGFPFPRPYRNVQISNVDFEYCEWLPGKSGLRPVERAVNCIFDNCKLASALNKHFDRCSFKGAKLVETQSTPGTVFQDCNFEGCHFNKGCLQECQFLGCRFDSVKFRNTEFYECLFDACTFDGADFKRSSFGASTFRNAKNNFRYNKLQNDRYEIDEEIIDPEYTLVDFMDSLMGQVKIS